MEPSPAPPCRDSYGRWRGPGPRRGFVPRSFPCFESERAALASFCLDFSGLSSGSRRFIAHVVSRQAVCPWDYADGVPIYYEDIMDLDDDRHRPSAQAVYGPLVDAGVLSVSSYETPEGDAPGLSRCFSVDGEVLDAIAASGPRTAAEAAAERRVDMARNDDSPEGTEPATHERYDESRNRIGGSLYREALKRLTHDYVYEPGVVAYLNALKADVDAAREAWQQAGGRRYVAGAEEQVNQAKASALSRGRDFGRRDESRVVEAWRRKTGEGKTAEYAAYDGLRRRWRNDRACWNGVLLQGPAATGVPGVLRYPLAYRHQSSGRMGAVKGAMQSCSREMKAAARDPLTGFFGLCNYDLRAAFPSLLISLFREANAHKNPPVPALDPSWLEDYVTEEQAKHRRAARVGLTVDSWKTVLSAILCAASLGPSVARSKGEVARCVREECSTPEAAEQVWAALREEVGPIYRELQRWHRWLDEVYAHDPDTSTAARGKAVAGRSGCRSVRNAAGETWLRDPAEPDHSRRARLAAHILQGREQSFILPLIAGSGAHGFEVLANEHDGVVTLGPIPPEAMNEALRIAGLTGSLSLVPKGFV